MNRLLKLNIILIIVIFLCSALNLLKAEHEFRLENTKLYTRLGYAQINGLLRSTNKQTSSGYPEVELDYFFIPKIAIGIGSEFHFVSSLNTVDYWSLNGHLKFYFFNQGNFNIERGANIEVERKEKLAIYIIGSFKRYTYALPLDPSIVNAGDTSGHFFTANIGVGADYLINRYFALNIQALISAKSFSETDVRIHPTFNTIQAGFQFGL